MAILKLWRLLTSYPLAQSCFPCVRNCKQGDLLRPPIHQQSLCVVCLQHISLWAIPTEAHACPVQTPLTGNVSWRSNLLPQTSVAHHSHHTSLWTSCPKCLHRHSTVDLPSPSLAFHTLPSLKSKVLYNPFQKNRFLVLIPIKLTSRLLKNNQ